MTPDPRFVPIDAAPVERVIRPTTLVIESYRLAGTDGRGNCSGCFTAPLTVKSPVIRLAGTPAMGNEW
jgi:hypothetical protein